MITPTISLVNHCALCTRFWESLETYSVWTVRTSAHPYGSPNKIILTSSPPPVTVFVCDHTVVLIQFKHQVDKRMLSKHTDLETFHRATERRGLLLSLQFPLNNHFRQVDSSDMCIIQS